MRIYYDRNKRKYSELNYEGKYLLDPKYMTKRDLQHYFRYHSVAKKPSRLKRIVIIIFFICLCSYVFIDYNLRAKLLALRDRFDVIERIDVNLNISQAYFIDTQGCRMPYFDVTNTFILQHMYRPTTYECKKSLTYTNDDNQLLINMDEADMLTHFNTSDLDDFNCSYSIVKRKSDNRNQYSRPVPFKLRYGNTSLAQIGKSIEVIRVKCYNKEQKLIYKGVHYFVPDLEAQKTNETSVETPKQLEPEKRFNFDDQAGDIPERLSVMMLGIDSVSHLNFLRQMRRTAAYVRQNLSHVEFWGYNKVGDNTYPNLVPLLTGLDESELNISCLMTSFQIPKYDDCPLIWKRFKSAGFSTIFAEDVSSLGLFNYGKDGFKNQPTDYYFHTAMLEMERNIASKKLTNVFYCMGERRTADVLFDYMQKLIPKMQKSQFFSFFWSASMTHDQFNAPSLIDADIKHILELYEMHGILNRTFIFLLSDHGMRWGSFRKTYQGMMEERQPLLMTLYPKWLAQRYAGAIKHLNLNAKHLTTPFDLYETLMDLIDLRNLEMESLNQRSLDIKQDLANGLLPRGISLFVPIPLTRNCEQAGIAAHWCTCYGREEMQTTDLRVQRAARFIVNLINERIKEYGQCRTLYLNSIHKAYLAGPQKNIVKDVTNDYEIDITLRLRTKPGLGIFETTVRFSSYGMTLTGTISRINLYGSQSYCIDDYSLKMFCYCHR